MTAKKCLACNSPVKGRIDKKFCGDSCRNNYNNQMNHYSKDLVRNINYILRRNRRILEVLLAPLEKKSLVIKRQNLAEKGFQFEYSTEHHPYGKEEHYYYCYEYGYLSIDQYSVLVVEDTRKKQYVSENSQEMVNREG